MFGKQVSPVRQEECVHHSCFAETVGGEPWGEDFPWRIWTAKE
ncbi:hypothetical protein LCGC14_3145520, partial [marine sediment metagenome]